MFTLFLSLCASATPSPSGYKRSLVPSNYKRAPVPSNYKRAPAPEPTTHVDQQRKRSLPAQSVLDVDFEAFANELCPDTLAVCPLVAPGRKRANFGLIVPTSLREWTEQGWECVEIENDISSCGGCASLEPR
jgi:hypothetical protein